MQNALSQYTIDNPVPQTSELQRDQHKQHDRHDDQNNPNPEQSRKRPFSDSEHAEPTAKGSRLCPEDALELGSNLVEADFGVFNKGRMRQEIEIGLISLNGSKFIGTITPQEAKFTVYRDTLGFPDFSNFDGVRFAFRGILVVVFKLKTAINVDELQFL